MWLIHSPSYLRRTSRLALQALWGRPDELYGINAVTRLRALGIPLLPAHEGTRLFNILRVIAISPMPLYTSTSTSNIQHTAFNIQTSTFNNLTTGRFIKYHAAHMRSSLLPNPDRCDFSGTMWHAIQSIFTWKWHAAVANLAAVCLISSHGSKTHCITRPLWQIYYFEPKFFEWR